MKFILLSGCLVTSTFATLAQVGIGTTTPEKLLTVNGSVLLDAGNNNQGTLDSAALLFGTTTGVGIASNRTGGTNVNGLDIYTNDTARISITHSGNVGIGITDPEYTLDVLGAISTKQHARIADNIYAKKNLLVGNNVNVTGRVGIGVDASPLYQLNINGSAYIDNSIHANEDMLIGGTLQVGARPIVRSNSNTQMRLGFSSGYVNITVPPETSVNVQVPVTPFEGNNNNIRVSISQFDTDISNSSGEGEMIIKVMAVNAATDMCTIKFYNPAPGTLILTGTIHLLNVVTE